MPLTAPYYKSRPPLQKGAVSGTLGKGADEGTTRQLPVSGFEGAVIGKFFAGAVLEGAGSGPFLEMTFRSPSSAAATQKMKVPVMAKVAACRF